MSDEMAIHATHEHVRMLFTASLTAVEPRRATADALRSRKERLRAPVTVISIGKAAIAMVEGAVDELGEAIVDGVIVAKAGQVAHSSALAGLTVLSSSHPVPDDRSINAARAVIDAIERTPGAGTVLALISGGASALVELPADAFALEEISAVTAHLLAAGATIHQLNAVRRTMSRVKGGGLRAAMGGRRCVSLLLSDVLGNDPAVIGSGPTVLPSSTQGSAADTLDRYGLPDQLNAVGRRIKSNQHTLSIDTTEDDLMIVADNAALVDRMAYEAEVRGAQAQVWRRDVEGESRIVAREFVGYLADLPDEVDVVLGGGELTVTVRGDGVGGRNTEFALAAALELDRSPIPWVVASFGSDGDDGTSGAAGAIADTATVARAKACGVDAEASLTRNDSAPVFSSAGGLVVTGQTGTNVNDVYVAWRVQDALG